MLGLFDYLVVVLRRKMTTGLSNDAPENPHSPRTELLSPRCPFHKYTASSHGLASFPRKRESRKRAPWRLDARLRGHDVLLASDLRNRHLGPRGSGKSTWLRAIFPEAHVFDFAGGGYVPEAAGASGVFAAELRALTANQWVIIDEVQRLPNLLNEVHRFIEAKRLRFVLCGSSARKLKRADVNLLAGRALRRSMHPFVPMVAQLLRAYKDYRGVYDEMYYWAPAGQVRD